MTDFSNRKAIVLGGTSGIGLATTEMLRDGGAEVVAGGRRECEIDGVECVQVDVLDRVALDELFEKHHGFDYLVNAATGGPRALEPFLEMDPQGYQDSFAKLWGYVNSVRLGVPQMSANGAVVLFSGYPARKWRAGTIAIGSVGEDEVQLGQKQIDLNRFFLGGGADYAYSGDVFNPENQSICCVQHSGHVQRH